MQARHSQRPLRDNEHHRSHRILQHEIDFIADQTLPTEAHNDDSTLTTELAAIEDIIGHSGNEIDMTDMKNTIDKKADVITHQAVRLISVGCIDMMKFVPHMGPSPFWDFDGLHLSASGSKALGRKLKHSGNEIDMTDTKNAIDMQTDVITHQAIRFVSSDNADVNALSSSLFEYVIVTTVSNDTWIQSNNVEANSTTCLKRTTCRFT